ncbi:unnamed protein product, partial [Prorocentrum cordatum]
GALDEATEVADWFALRSLHKTLDIGSEPTAPSASAASAAAAARVAAARPRGPDAEEVEQASALLRLVLPETLPRVLSLLDAYGPPLRLLPGAARPRPQLHGLARAGAAVPAAGGPGGGAGGDRRALAGRGAHGPWRRAVLLAPRLRADGVYIFGAPGRRWLDRPLLRRSPTRASRCTFGTSGCCGCSPRRTCSARGGGSSSSPTRGT